MQSFLPELRGHPTDLEAEVDVEIQLATEPGESRTQPSQVGRQQDFQLQWKNKHCTIRQHLPQH